MELGIGEQGRPAGCGSKAGRNIQDRPAGQGNMDLNTSFNGAYNEAVQAAGALERDVRGSVTYVAETELGMVGDAAYGIYQLVDRAVDVRKEVNMIGDAAYDAYRSVDNFLLKVRNTTLKLFPFLFPLLYGRGVRERQEMLSATGEVAATLARALETATEV